jgi:hypothetical protein
MLILDVLGKQIFNDNPNRTEVNLNLTKLTKGIYFIHVKTDNGMSVKKLIIR